MLWFQRKICIRFFNILKNVKKELCNIERYNIKCDKIMECNHQCMNIFGLFCPEICKIYHSDYENFIIYFGNEDDALFIIIQNMIIVLKLEI